MEMPFSDIQAWSEARPARGRPRETLRGAKRADIVLLDENERPVCMVEVKRFWDRTRCIKDLQRIRNLLLLCENQNAGSLKRGFVAMMLAKKALLNQSAGERTRGHAKRIKAIVREEFVSEGLTLRFHRGAVRNYPREFQRLREEPNWAHAGFCIELARKAKPA